MGTTTYTLYPYPELVDSANVPRDQKALAQAVEASRVIIAPHAVTALVTAYPPGTSVMTVGGGDGATWPAGSSCVVTTHRRADTPAGGQWCYNNSSSTARAWYRNGNSTAWSPWVTVADSRAATIAARGRVQITATASTTGTASITFPAGLFTTAPRMSAQPVGSSAWNSYLPSSPSASGANLGIRSTDAVAGSITLGVDWIAMEGE